MLLRESKAKVLAKLINASNELDDALNLSVPAARYDYAFISQGMRNELSALADDLKRIVRHLEGIQ